MNFDDAKKATSYDVGYKYKNEIVPPFRRVSLAQIVQIESIKEYCKDEVKYENYYGKIMMRNGNPFWTTSKN